VTDKDSNEVSVEHEVEHPGLRGPVHQLSHPLRSEVDVHEVLKVSRALELDSQVLPHLTADPVGAHQELAPQLYLLLVESYPRRNGEGFILSLRGLVVEIARPVQNLLVHVPEVVSQKRRQDVLAKVVGVGVSEPPFVHICTVDARFSLESRDQPQVVLL